MPDGSSFLIAIPTLGRRPVGALLDALRTQIDERGPSGVLDVVVIHNAHTEDDDLRATAEAAGARYNRVAAVGYARARNAALDMAQGYDHLLFIDDDELPGPTWLEAHLSAPEQWTADVVFGPVITELPSPRGRWMDEGRLIRPRRACRDGLVAGHVYSGNTSVRMSFVRSNDLRFDHDFDRSGGEDTDFFERCRARGARVVWVNGALVTEQPDAELLHLAGLLRRVSARARQNAVHRVFAGQVSRRAMALRSMARAAAGLGTLLAGLATLRMDRAARGMRDLASATGSLSGAVWSSSALSAPSPHENAGLGQC